MKATWAGIGASRKRHSKWAAYNEGVGLRTDPFYFCSMSLAIPRRRCWLIEQVAVLEAGRILDGGLLFDRLPARANRPRYVRVHRGKTELPHTQLAMGAKGVMNLKAAFRVRKESASHLETARIGP